MKIFVKLSKFYRYAYKMGHFPSLTEIFSTHKKIFAYYGYLGDNNFGDELVFESAKKIFEPNILLPVRKFMPFSIKIFCFLFKSKFSGVVIGGGTLIGPFWDRGFFMDLIALNKPVYIHGTGVHKNIDSGEQWKSVLGGLVYGGVRGYLSRENLTPIFPNFNIAGDAAFAFFDKTNWGQKPSGQKNVLVNLGTHFDYEEQDHSRKELKKFIKSLIESGYTVQFLPFHVIDNELGAKLKSEIPEIQLLKQPDSYISAVNIFQNCSFAIGERLHFTVMAILTRSPFISLNYGKKHEDLLHSIELSHAGLQPGSFSLNDLKTIFNNQASFNWGCTEKTITDFRDFQIREAHDFIAKH